MTDRVACIIPGCGHTCRKLWPGHEWLCSEHWRFVPLVLRCRRRDVRARLRRRGEVVRLESGYYLAKTIRAARLEDMFWRRMRIAALQRVAGI